MRWAASSARACVGASTITRTRASVPLGRTSTRPLAAELGLDGGDGVGDARCGVGHRRAHRHVDEDLRQAGHRGGGQLGERAAGAVDGVAQDDPGEQPVAGRGEVAEDDVAALLAAQRVAAGGERLEHVAVADGGLDDLDAGRLHAEPEAEVRHHGHHHGAVAQQPGGVAVDGEDADDVVAVDEPAGVVDGEQPVGVAVEGQPEVGAVLDDGGRQRRRVGGPAAGVDVAPVGGVVDGDDVGAGERQQRTGQRAGRAVGGVDDDPQPVEAAPADGAAGRARRRPGWARCRRAGPGRRSAPGGP